MVDFFGARIKYPLKNMANSQRTLGLIFVLLLTTSISSCSGNNEDDDDENGKMNEIKEDLELDFTNNNYLTYLFVPKLDLGRDDAVDNNNNNTSNNTGTFLQGFYQSLTVILVSEVGDKTFFIAAIMAMTNNRLLVFLGAISALGLMTVLSAALGMVFTLFIPRVYTYYACTGLMFLFGFKMFWDAYRMKDNEADEIQQEVQAQLGLTTEGGVPASAIKHHSGSLVVGIRSLEEDDDNKGKDTPRGSVIMHPSSGTMVVISVTGDPDDPSSSCKDPSSIVGQDQEEEHLIVESAGVMDSKFMTVVKTFSKCFFLTFLAEWGDRSQLATIVLAGGYDMWGVMVGGVAGHAVCTGAAVIAGALVARWISVRVVTVIGGLVFLGFAIASCFFDAETGESLV